MCKYKGDCIEWGSYIVILYRELHNLSCNVPLFHNLSKHVSSPCAVCTFWCWWRQLCDQRMGCSNSSLPSLSIILLSICIIVCWDLRTPATTWGVGNSLTDAHVDSNPDGMRYRIRVSAKPQIYGYGHWLDKIHMVSTSRDWTFRNMIIKIRLLMTFKSIHISSNNFLYSRTGQSN